MRDTTPRLFQLIIYALILGGALFVGLYRYDLRVRIEYRLWVYDVNWMYQTWEESCSMNSDDEWECDSELVTRTRCTDTNAGEFLPTVKPEHTCHTYWGDYPEDDQYGRVWYFAKGNEDIRTARFPLYYWNQVASGERLTVTMNIFGNIVGLPGDGQ